VRAAVGRTDGWAAGLRLVALAARADQARRTLVPSTDAEDVLIADYVWHEVLAAERPAVVDMLLDTCVVRRVNASLAETLTDRSDAGKLLLEAEERGLFVTRLGTSGWVEVHSVVREELLAEAMRRSQQRIAQLHARAAKWFEERGEVRFALEHWVLAGVRAMPCDCWLSTPANCTTPAARRRSHERWSTSRPIWPIPTSQRCSTSPGVSSWWIEAGSLSLFDRRPC